MLTRMLTRVGVVTRRRAEAVPWTNVYGLARSLLAGATLGTLLASPASTLFGPSPGAGSCRGLGTVTLFCLVPSSQLEVARFAAVAGLLVVAGGWRPRVTALPHWWITFSFHAATTVPDGGDQLASIITLLLIPVALSDRRRWHWSPPQARVEATELGSSLVAWSAIVVIRLQVAGVYFQTSVAKLGREEWADGTALYYWLTDPQFAPPAAWDGLLNRILASPVGVTLFTWGPLIIEFAIAMGLFLRRRTWPYLLAMGIAFHAGIAIFMGLASFAVVMIAALTLHLRMADDSITLPSFLPKPRGTLFTRGARPEVAEERS